MTKSHARSTLALLCAAACGGAENAPRSKCSQAYDAIVVTSDYSSSGVGGLSLDGGVTLGFGVDLGKDPALAVSRGRVFFVARDQDQVFELDGACGAPIARFSVHSLARLGVANPQDVAAAADGALWVPLFNEPALAVLKNGAADRVDLSTLDADGNPQATAVRIVDVGGAAKAFVVLEMLDADLKSRRPSKMARFDVATRALEETVELAGRNPFGAIRESDDGMFWLAAPGNFDALGEPQAGIERFDPQTHSSRLVVGEPALGGSAVQVAVHGRCGAAIVADATSKNATSLVTFDADTGAVLAGASRPVMRTDDFDLRSLAWFDDQLLVGDRRRGAAGYPIHVFARGEGCALSPRADLVVSQKPIDVRAGR